MRRLCICLTLSLSLAAGCSDKKSTTSADQPSLPPHLPPSSHQGKTPGPAATANAGRIGHTPVANNTGEHLAVRSAKVMGTRVTLSIWGHEPAKAARVTEEVFKEFRRIDRLMTSWGNDSDVSKINANAGKRAVVVDPEVFKVIMYAQKVSKQSGGAFDITVGGFRGLWKFDQDLDGTIPDPAEVKKRLAKIGYKRVLVDPKKHTVKLADPGMRITLGGVAKGYAVDQAVALLHKRGFVDFILQAGGDLYTSGQRGAREWRVGIRDPRGPPDKPFALAKIKNHTFSTSGDYERGFVKNGIRYHHILNPATGFPAKKCRSVTVMTKKAMVADAWSTSLFVLGPQKGARLLDKMPGISAVFVDDKNQIHITKGLKGKVWILRKPTPGP